MVCPAGQRPSRPPIPTRAEIVARLQARRSELEEAILVRVYAVSKPSGTEGTEYLQGMRTAVAAAVSHGLAGIELGEEQSGPVPLAIVDQARRAARNRVGLEVVLRRYVAGYSAFVDFLLQEADRGDALVPAAMLYHLQRELTAILDRLVALASAEYQREEKRAAPSPARRLARRVERLLAGELVETVELNYDLDAWHIGIISTEPEIGQALQDFAVTLDRRPLIVESGDQVVWAWFGGRHKLDASAFLGLASIASSSQASLTLGEPAYGLSGWRLTHRQAETALAVALRRRQPFARYADVAFLGSILRNDDLITFLTDAFLVPLHSDRDGGETIRQTLRAYFAAGRNISSAAAELGVTRQTVTSRIRAIEERLGRHLDTCGAEIEVALQLVDLGFPTVLSPKD